MREEANFKSNEEDKGTIIVGNVFAALFVIIVGGFLCFLIVSAVVHIGGKPPRYRFGKDEDKIIADLIGKEIGHHWIVESPDDFESLRIERRQLKYTYWRKIEIEAVLHELDSEDRYMFRAELTYDLDDNLVGVRCLEWGTILGEI